MSIRSVMWVIALSLLPTAAAAQAPSPIDAKLFAFPGSLEHPPSGVSAGFALADQWLGDDPFSNPAAPRQRRVTLSPTLFRISRQDLRAANRNYDDQSPYIDLAGASLGVPYVPLWIYVYQPALRFEEYVFTRGTGTDPTVQPATISGQADTREGRAGLATSFGWGPMRAGAALEWSRRQDRYVENEQSGAPDQGRREVNFDGNAMGGTFGLRFDSADSGAGRITVGVGARYVPELEVTGEQTLDLLSGSSVTPITATRAAGWEGGVSARYFVNADFAALVAAGGRTEQEWTGLGVTSGASAMWRVALYYHDSADPWAVRLGMGQDRQDGAPEPRAGVVGLGLGWDVDGAILDFGLLHRSIERASAPRSYEDRVIASVRVDF
jgi:hypothetical protein